MENFTIHIFGYGETQINSKDLSVKVATDSLTTVEKLVDAIWAKKPGDNKSEKVFHSINIFSHSDVRWGSKNGFTVKDEKKLVPLIDAVVAELQTKKDEEIAAKTTTTSTTKK